MALSSWNRICFREGSGGNIDGSIIDGCKRVNRKSSRSSSERSDGVLEECLSAKSVLRIFEGKNIAEVPVEMRRNQETKRNKSECFGLVGQKKQSLSANNTLPVLCNLGNPVGVR